MEADPDGNTVIFQLLLLLLFTLMNAFFAGAEMAVVSVQSEPYPFAGRGWKQKSPGDTGAL